jgi:hypothetical protein
MVWHLILHKESFALYITENANSSKQENSYFRFAGMVKKKVGELE